MVAALAKKNPLNDKKFKGILQPGNFYRPCMNSAGENDLEKADDNFIAQAGSLLTMPLYAVKKEDIITTIKHYCRFFGCKNFDELEKFIPNGVVVYCANNHPKPLEELRTLIYFERSLFYDITPTELGYIDLYKKFIEPKLFIDGALVGPDNFALNMLTSSYSNRIFDLCMGMLYEAILHQGENPEPYLKKCYGFHLIASPYNFSPKWLESADWRKPVLQFVSSDSILNFADIAPRIFPIHEFFYHRFRKSGDNVFRLAGMARQAVIVVPKVKEDFSDMTQVQIAAAILGHDLSDCITALESQEPALLKIVRDYFSGQISKATFDHLRNKPSPYVYQYNPLKGFPLKDLTPIKEGILPSDFAIKVLSQPDFYFDLFALIFDADKIKKNDNYFVYKIYYDLLEAVHEDPEDLVEFGERTALLTPFEWFSLHGKAPEVITMLFMRSSLADCIYDFLQKNPKDLKKVKNFFQVLLRAEKSDNKETFLEIMFTGPETKILKEKDLSLLKKQDNFYLKNIRELQENLENEGFFAKDFYMMACMHFKHNSTPTEVYQKKCEEVLEIQKNMREQSKKLGNIDTTSFNKLMLFPIKTTSELLEGRTLLWDYTVKAVEKFYNSGELNYLYCALLKNTFAYSIGLRLRTANYAYTKYLEYNHKKNPNSEPLRFNQTAVEIGEIFQDEGKEDITYDISFDNQSGNVMDEKDEITEKNNPNFKHK